MRWRNLRLNTYRRCSGWLNIWCWFANRLVELNISFFHIFILMFILIFYPQKAKTPSQGVGLRLNRDWINSQDYSVGVWASPSNCSVFSGFSGVIIGSLGGFSGLLSPTSKTSPAPVRFSVPATPAPPASSVVPA